MDLKEMLLNEKIIKIKTPDEEPFILKSGKKSRLFIDIKQASLNPLILEEIVTCIDELLINEEFDMIGSVAIGSIPIASVYSYIRKVPQIIVRNEKHDRGTQSQIIGNCKNKTVILLEDVATSGGSIVNSVKAIREASGICDTCIVIVNREEGANELCTSNNISLIPILNKSDFGLTENL